MYAKGGDAQRAVVRHCADPNSEDRLFVRMRIRGMLKFK